MSTADINGRLWAKLSDLSVGDRVEVDGGFTCLRAGEQRLIAQDQRGELYISCEEGEHFIDGQADDGEHCIGLYKIEE